MRILICGATGTELQACKKAIGRVKNKKAHFEFLLTGIGPVLSGKALKVFLENSIRANNPPTNVVSTGFAGTFNKDLAIGDIVIAKSISDAEGAVNIAFSSPINDAASKLGAKSRDFFCSSKVVDVGTKGNSDLVVDMESAALARVCREKEIPFSVFRVISDTPDKPLPGFLNYWTDILQQPDKFDTKLSLGAAGAALGKTASHIAKNPFVFVRFLATGVQVVKILESSWASLAQELD